MKNGDFPWFFVCLPEGNTWDMGNDQQNLQWLGSQPGVV